MKDLFLCHNSVDKDWVEDLGAEIEAEEWNGRQLSVFLDKWDIEPGENILLKLNDALDSSRFVAVVMTPEMMGSEWCLAEVTATLANDPTNRTGRLLPLLVRDQHLATGQRLAIPPILRAFNHLDFRTKPKHKESFARLLARLRGEPAPRGRGRARSRSQTPALDLAPAIPARSDEPDQIQEAIISNLLEVRHIPTTIWSAPTSLRAHADLPKGEHFEPFVLKEGRLLSFRDLGSEAGSLFEYIGSGVQRHGVRDWRDDDARWRWVIELLNRHLRDHLRRAGVRFDGRSGRFFFMPRDGGSAVLRWGTGTRRVVAKAPDPERGGNWVHQAARLRFETLGPKLYLSIEPTYVFTTDGRTPVDKDKAGPLTMKWGGKERNGAILRHVLMWSDALAQGKKTSTIPCGRQSVLISRLPAVVRAPVGIVGDSVRFGALLQFTEQELNLTPPGDAVFGYEDPEREIDDEDEEELPF